MEDREAISSSNCPHLGADTPSRIIKEAAEGSLKPSAMTRVFLPMLPRRAERGNRWSQEPMAWLGNTWLFHFLTRETGLFLTKPSVPGEHREDHCRDN